MQFNMNRKQAAEKAGQKSGSYEPLPKGVYEVIIKNTEERATPRGAEELQLDLVVRNDLDGVQELANTNGKYHNRHVFMDNWKMKSTNDYNEEDMMLIAYAAGVPDGAQINGVGDLIQYLNGKPIRAYINQEDDTYKGQTRVRNRVRARNLEPTQFPNVNHKWDKQYGLDESQGSFTQKPTTTSQQGGGDPFAKNTGNNDNVDISDDDLPF